MVYWGPVADGVPTGMPQYAAWWQLKALAGVCAEATDAVNRTLRQLFSRRAASGWTQLSGMSCDFLKRFNLSEDIICLARPELLGAPFFPFFGYCPRRKRQVVLVADLNRRYDAVNYRWEQLPGAVTEQCPDLLQICPAFFRVKRVAFLYDRWLDGRWVRDPLPYIQRLGLQHLWPYNMPALEEIYLLDHSIRLLPG